MFLSFLWVWQVYLEKPGAPTVAELESMATLAEAKGVKVFMGYNKNVTKVRALHRVHIEDDAWGVWVLNHSQSYTVVISLGHAQMPVDPRPNFVPSLLLLSLLRRVPVFVFVFVCC